MSGPSRVQSVGLSRLRTVSTDPLESIGLPSKGDRRLLDRNTQESYYQKIVDRYLRFYAASAGAGDRLADQLVNLSVTTDPEDTIADAVRVDEVRPMSQEKELAILLAAMRKLREGLVASHRVDEFAAQVYYFCIRAAILVKHFESYHPALLHLLRVIHHCQPLPPLELQEFGGYLVLDLACRQQDFAQAYAIRHAYKVHERRIESLLQALVHGNYHAFWKMKTVVDGYKAKIVEQAEDGIRAVALKSLGRAYFSVDAAFLTQVTASTWEDLKANCAVGWELDGERVIIRRAKTPTQK